MQPRRRALLREPAAHSHHIEFRCAGGSDDGWNLVALCAAHHLHGIHPRRLRVGGRAPDEMEWEVKAEGRWVPFTGLRRTSCR